MLSCKKTDKLLGVHIINAIAGDIISGACIGIEYGAASEEPKGQFRDLIRIRKEEIVVWYSLVLNSYSRRSRR